MCFDGVDLYQKNSLALKHFAFFIKAVLSSFKICFGDGGKSLYKYYQNMYLV
jgi:hypothetical protein